MTFPSHQGKLILMLATLVTALIYWPGLAGSFVFDDQIFVVSNRAIHASSLDLADWVNAALSFPASHQGRWLGMLSFAANHYLTGMDPSVAPGELLGMRSCLDKHGL